MTTQALDMAQVEACAGQMLGVLNQASVALMTSIGHQTGLFDTMAGLPAATVPADPTGGVRRAAGHRATAAAVRRVGPAPRGAGAARGRA